MTSLSTTMGNSKDTEMNGIAFWMVWNPKGHAPTVKHATPERARTEATRLALNNPSEEFFILKAIARAKRMEPVSIDLLEDDLPF